MNKKELQISMEDIKAVKEHKCDYCGAAIKKGSKYVRLNSRIMKKERFPVILKVCDGHNKNLIPLMLLLHRPKK